MKITQLLQEDKVTLSLEVFPPKKDTAVEQVSRSVREIAALQPDFMSVTYGAGGGTSAYTVQIAKDIKADIQCAIYGTLNLRFLYQRNCKKTVGVYAGGRD